MRHAKSSWRNPQLDDHDRPLNGRGERAAPYMGEWLRQEGLLPDMILSSTAVRAVETAKCVAEASDFDGPMEITRKLYLADPLTYLETLTEVPEGTGSVLLIGHNPGISELLHQLTGEDEDMPTAAVACVDVDVSEIHRVDVTTRGTMRCFHRPPKENKKK